jgi:hypothetical protein
MESVSAKFLPKLLTVEQQEARLAVDTDLLMRADQDANFKRAIS